MARSVPFYSNHLPDRRQTLFQWHCKGSISVYDTYKHLLHFKFTYKTHFYLNDNALYLTIDKVCDHKVLYSLEDLPFLNTID